MNLTPLLDIFDELPAYAAAETAVDGRTAELVLGLPRSARPPILAKLAMGRRVPILLVAGRVEQVPIWMQELEAWLPEGHTLVRFPEATPLPYERGPWGENSRQQRLTVLSHLMAGQHPLIPAEDTPLLIVTSARALMQKSLPKRNFIKATRVVRLGQMVDWAKLEESWQAAGYERVTVVERHGQYSQRGGIVDIFPAGGGEFPIRIELFGDEVDTLRWFDPATQRTVTELPPPQRVLIPPAREAVPADGVELGQVLQLDAPDKEDELPSWQDDIPNLLGARPFANAEFYLPLIYQRPDSLLHYLPDNALVVVDDWAAVGEAIHELTSQADQLHEEQASLPPAYPSPVFTWEELSAWLGHKRPLVLGEWHKAEERPTNAPLTPLAEAFGAGPRFGGQTKPLIYQLQYAQRVGERTIVASRQAPRLAELWRNDGKQGSRGAGEQGGWGAEEQRSGGAEEHGRGGEEERKGGSEAGDSALSTQHSALLTFVHGSIGEGFTLERAEDNKVLLNLLSDAEIFGWNRPAPRAQKARRSYAPESFFADIVAGDYVVHSEYGIGRFLGLVVRAISDSDREYLKIEYANDDILYVPVHHADRLSKWMGAAEFAPNLHRLGGKQWGESRQKAQKAINEMADELLELYAAREEIHGHAFGKDTEWQAELEASFAYQETDDQIRAIQDVKADMERPLPMDRLICGDVGFGKTEVALRAAFKAVMDGRQVAILVPTTVLAQQHFHNFRQRLETFPVKVAMLSRFLTHGQQEDVVQKLKNGAVDIVIGTHRLLSDDIRFHNLGLLIIDEEQRFGVAHKERLKQLRTEVDVLTMTATPIPRTMHMAIAGVRDVSIINTAPAERLPVQTYVGEFEEQLVRRAILRELDRGGQIYFVHNRVQSIEMMKRRLEEIAPEAIIAIGHGQMGERELEQVMEQFAEGHVDILLSTTIIESGLDIPNANTLIVDRADTFGLAQLYQLRGRVGRGAHRAYSYFFHPRWGTLAAESQARLEAIASATELGAGYSIAMRDLEIRGAGELLGASQSGHIAAIGFDLYTRMLATAVRLRKQAQAAEPGEVIKVETVETVLIDLPLPTYIPPDYVPDAGLRLRLYRRMAGLVTLEEIEGMAAELLDRFGPIPAPVENLLYQLRVKVMAGRAGASAVTHESSQIRIQIPNLHNMDRVAMQRFLGEQVRVSRTGVWFMKDLATQVWQVGLVQVLEKLGRRK
ncbi:MAG: transcription-repair coupling factor [Chloroflexi bacterium]|nr:transcription-repair coupling factor [Chloroflexota bacterium]